jgi:hypothetical protein
MGEALEKLVSLAQVDVKPHVRKVNGKLVRVKGHKRLADVIDPAAGVPWFGDLAKAESWFKDNVGPHSDLTFDDGADGDDLQAIQDIAAQTEKLMRRYPNIQTPKKGVRNGRPFGGILTYDSDDTPPEVRQFKGQSWGSTAGNTAKADSTRMQIWISPGGYDLVGAVADTHASVGRTVDGRRFPAIVPENPAQAITHELGHVLSANVGVNDDRQAFADIVSEVWPTFEDLAADVSQYATASPQEAFSEIFVLLNHPEAVAKKSKVSKLRLERFRQMFNRLYGDIL